ncbi:MAG: antibiotic biosynthesis monooxygenase [Pseudomonadota bacterium]
MYVVVVEFEIVEGAFDRFLELVRRNAALSLRDEPACSRFDVCTASDRPGTVFLYEIYDDAAGFEAHTRTRHFIDFDGAVGPLTAGKEVRIYDLQPEITP